MRPEPSWLRQAARVRGFPAWVPPVGTRGGGCVPTSSPLKRRARGAEAALRFQSSSWGWREGQQRSGSAPSSGAPKASPWEMGLQVGPQDAGTLPCEQEEGWGSRGCRAGWSTILGDWASGAGSPRAPGSVPRHPSKRKKTRVCRTLVHVSPRAQADAVQTGTRWEAASWEEAGQRGPGWPGASADPGRRALRARCVNKAERPPPPAPRGPGEGGRQQGAGSGTCDPPAGLGQMLYITALCPQLQDSGLWLTSCWNVAASGHTDRVWGLSRAVPGRECAWLPSSPSAGQTWESHHQGHPPGLPSLP